jgi:hypothetical protein
MKHFFLAILFSIVISSSISATNASSTFTETEQNLIDSVITRWHARQPADLLATRTQAIIDRINNLQERGRFTEKAAMLLNYIEIRLTNILNALENKPLIPTSPIYPSDPSLPNTPNSGTFPSTMTIPERFDTSPLVIAWTTSPLFWEIRYSVTSEPMIITDVVLQASRDTINDYVAEFALYDESGRFIAKTTNSGRTVRFNALDLRRETGSQRFYVAVSTYGVDNMYSTAPVNFTLSLQSIVADWVYSNSMITPNLQNNISPTITISPVGIDTVQFISTWNGYAADSYLVNGETTLGILEITTPDVDSMYTQDISLLTLTVQVADNTTARQLANNLRLERLDNRSTNSIQGTVQGNTVTFQLANLGDNTIEQGNDAIFRFFANIPLDNNTRESVQLRITNLKNGGLTYRLDGTNESITTIQQSAWEIFGPQIID